MPTYCVKCPQCKAKATIVGSYAARQGARCHDCKCPYETDWEAQGSPRSEIEDYGTVPGGGKSIAEGFHPLEVEKARARFPSLREPGALRPDGSVYFRNAAHRRQYYGEVNAARRRNQESAP